MKVRPGIAILFGEPKVDYIELVGLLTESDEEVLRLDIKVDEVLAVNVFEQGNHLLSYHQHCFQGKFLFAELEQVFQGRTKDVDHHHLMRVLFSKPVDSRNAS